jgi:transcriptional regulator with XRE-family HTH domain
MITGEQVKAARKLLSWSLVRLASKSGLSDTTIAKFERGESRRLAAAGRRETERRSKENDPQGVSSEGRSVG